VQVQFFPLTPDDASMLERQRLLLRALVEARQGPLAPSWTCDAATLQALLDDEVLEPSQTYELQCLGVVLGDLLLQTQGFAWAIIHDEHGRDPTVRWKDTSICVHALSMISKRVEAGEIVDVDHLLRVAAGRARDLEARERTQ